MSRGLGALQRRIMAELERAGGLASTDRLRERFPREAADKSLYRAIRSLERLGAVEAVDRPVLETPRRTPGRDRVLVLNFGHSDGDKELIRQTEDLCNWVTWLARERGVPVPEEVRKGLWDLKTARGRSSGG